MKRGADSAPAFLLSAQSQTMTRPRAAGAAGPHDVPAPGPGQAEQPAAGMYDHGPAERDPAGAMAPVIRVGRGLIDVDLMGARPVLGIKELPLAITWGASSDAGEPPTLDDHGRRQ